jgi:hypothetical protein
VSHLSHALTKGICRLSTTSNTPRPEFADPEGFIEQGRLTAILIGAD